MPSGSTSGSSAGCSQGASEAVSLRVAIVGYGRMGRIVERLSPEYGCQVVRVIRSAENGSGEALTRETLAGVEVAIEFTNPAAAPGNLRKLIERGVAVVTGTTGWFEELPEIRRLASDRGTGLVWGPNFSIGLHHFRRTVAEAARRFAREEAYGAWGWDLHHAAKRDAPSGTLLALAREIAESGYTRPVSLSSNRAGTVPGTHEIGFDSAEDTITLRHEARSRDGFARGALRAAQWLSGKAGCYEFREIADRRS
jgi:4-hydroxy-tetrahydrodipicolinate reductase